MTIKRNFSFNNVRIFFIARLEISIYTSSSSCFVFYNNFHRMSSSHWFDLSLTLLWAGLGSHCLPQTAWGEFSLCSSVHLYIIVVTAVFRRALGRDLGGRRDNNSCVVAGIVIGRSAGFPASGFAVVDAGVCGLFVWLPQHNTHSERSLHLHCTVFNFQVWSRREISCFWRKTGTHILLTHDWRVVNWPNWKLQEATCDIISPQVVELFHELHAERHRRRPV